MADGYVRLKCSAPGTVVNATDSLVGFEAERRVECAEASMVAQTMAAALESAARSNAAERGRTRALLFGEPQLPDALLHGEESGLNAVPCDRS